MFKKIIYKIMGILYLIVAMFLMYLSIKLCVDMSVNISNKEFKLFLFEMIALVFSSTYALITGTVGLGYLFCKPLNKQDKLDDRNRQNED